MQPLRDAEHVVLLRETLQRFIREAKSCRASERASGTRRMSFRAMSSRGSPTSA